MAFNSANYLLFLSAAFVLFWLLKRSRWTRVLFLLLASYLFYAVWNGWLVVLIFGSSLVDYLCGGLLARCAPGTHWRRLLLIASVTLNLGLLAYFKYANFFISNVSAALDAMGIAAQATPLDILLPVGISFYTFQSMSYTIDIYRGVLQPARSPAEFFLFVAYFPQLVAGPIVRAREFLPQLEREPTLSGPELNLALFRLLRGLFKKMVIADYLAATLVNPYFMSVEGTGGSHTFLALLAFHFQVYCDFSGYTDIAIGSAGLFGFKLPENFSTPYGAHTPANYWRRWHLTLSRFCFDYIYKPLGGSRNGELSAYLNTLITFGLIGFWHGANWNYVLFGVYHALGVIGTRMVTGLVGRLTRRTRNEVEEELTGRFLPILATNLFIVGSLPLFRAPDLSTAWLVYQELFHWQTLQVTFAVLPLVALGLAILSHGVPDTWQSRLSQRLSQLPVLIQAVLVLLFTAGVLYMGTVAQQSFVYFQF